MRSLRFILLLAAALSCLAQPVRMEVLSRPNDYVPREGASSMAAVPEFSRDGNFVLFVSSASNLTTNGPAIHGALNLYMTDRRTHETTLISRGLNGEPANDNVVNFEISANNRRILFETPASNLIPNDTNNATDVFIRDLDLNQTILVSANTNGVVSRRGGANATMSADGNFVAFTSSDKTLATDKSTTTLAEAFVRNVSAGTTRMLPIPPGYIMQTAFDPAISDDGQRVAFTAYVTLPNAPQSLGIEVLCDLSLNSSVRMADGIDGSGYDCFITPDGKFVTFGIQNGYSPRTNIIVRYSLETGATEMIVSNNVQSTVRPVAISSDAATILYLQDNGYRVYRDGLETRVLPHTVDGTPIALPATFGMAAMSADGKFVTFSTDVQLLASDQTDIQVRTYVYDVAQDALAELPTNGYGEPISDPVPNADGSLVLFTALSGFQEPAEPKISNIYVWDRVSGTFDLISEADVRSFENSDLTDSKLNDKGAFSDDGTKLVYMSRVPPPGVTAGNGIWNVFVLDRTTGLKQLASVAADGASPGTSASYNPVISGNGRMVAFLSGATNLAGVAGPIAPQLYVRDLQTQLTRLVKNTNGGPTAIAAALGGTLSFNHDGTRLVFASGAHDLTLISARNSQQIYIYDTTNAVVSMVSYDSTGQVGAFGDSRDPIISSDGHWVAFRSAASNLGITGGGMYLRDLTTGVLKHPGSPNSGTLGVSGTTAFDPTSSIMFYGAPGGLFQAYNIATGSQTRLVNGMTDASPSADGHWVAFLRREGTTFPIRNQAWLRDTVAGVETMVSTNSLAGAEGNLPSTHAHISSDGRFVVFESRATNLAPNDNNGTADIFMYDRDRQRLDLVSATPSGSSGNAASLRPVISPDDSFVAFVSYASDLIGHDFNDASDIFAAYFPFPDTDGDGIDDRWEMAHFGTLSHDMNLDTDGDGMSDGAEFAAGTDPQQAKSAFRVSGGAATPDSQTITVHWAAIPGHAYRVQARAKLDDAAPWQDISDAVIASHTDSALEVPLPVGATELYFRIVSAN